MSKTALIAVDVQNDYLPDGALGFPGSDEILLPLVEYATLAADVIIVSRNLHPANHGSFVKFGGCLPPNCIKGTPGARVVSNLSGIVAQPHNYVITKATEPDQGGFSAFEGGTLRPLESLEDILAREEVTHITVGGYWLEGAVANTAFDANALGYSVMVELRAAAGHPEKQHETLERMDRAGVLYA
jgi:nicotinamidase/pyrazinamidase